MALFKQQIAAPSLSFEAVAYSYGTSLEDSNQLVVV